MRITILKAGQTLPEVAARRGEFARWIRDAVAGVWRGRWSEHDLRGGGPLPARGSADAFIITGSRSSVTERLDWMLRAGELVREIVAARVPLFGICFGHQLIAEALGGRVEKNRLGREIGTVRVTRSGDDWLFAGLPRTFDMNATHVDAVTVLPPGAEVLARTDLDPFSAFRLGSARAVQLHPEFDADVTRAYVTARERLLRAEGTDPEAVLAHVHPGTRGTEILRNFARAAQRS